MFEYRDYNNVLLVEQFAPEASSPVSVHRNQVASIVRDNTMKALLADAVNAVIAETLGASLEQVQPDSRLVADLGMSAHTRRRLQQELAFIFNSNEINIANSMKVKGVLEQIANIEFSRLGLYG